MILPLFATAIVLLVTLWWTSWPLHNWRGTAFVACAIGAMLLEAVLPGMAPALLQLVTVLFGITAVLCRPRWMASATREEWTFIDEYVDQLQRVERLNERAASITPQEYVDAFDEMVQRLRKLRPPDPELARLHTRAVRELSRRLVIMRTGDPSSKEIVAQARANWAAVDEEYRSILRRRFGFWGRR